MQCRVGMNPGDDANESSALCSAGPIGHMIVERRMTDGIPFGEPILLAMTGGQERDRAMGLLTKQRAQQRLNARRVGNLSVLGSGLQARRMRQAPARKRGISELPEQPI